VIVDADKPAPYERYQFKVWTKPLPDDSEITYIIPEIWWSSANIWARAQVFVWWLSIDNGTSVPGCVGLRHRSNVAHLAQSVYAEGILRSFGLGPVQLVTDYVSHHYLGSDSSRQHESRNPVVLYNPAKGLSVTKQLMARLPGTTFVPIQGLSALGVAELMRHSRVYIDFGHFPGRDRLPREAILSGLIVISGRRGAGLFHEDLPIPTRFKIDESHLETIGGLIQDAVDNYATMSIEFQNSQATLLRDIERFTEEVTELVSLSQCLCASRKRRETTNARPTA
jgi:hypothetical protein